MVDSKVEPYKWYSPYQLITNWKFIIFAILVDQLFITGGIRYLYMHFNKMDFWQAIRTFRGDALIATTAIAYFVVRREVNTLIPPKTQENGKSGVAQGSLQRIFKDANSFNAFRIDVYDSLNGRWKLTETWKWNEKYALSVGVFIIAIFTLLYNVLLSGRVLHNGVVLEGVTLATNQRFFMINLVLNFFVNATFLFGLFLMVFVLAAVRKIKTLDKKYTEALTISKIKSALDSEPKTLEQYTHLSPPLLRDFQKSTKGITRISLIALAISILVFIYLNVWISKSIDVIQGSFYIIFLLAIDLIVFLLMFGIFFYPQITIHRLISPGKHALLVFLETMVQKLRAQYFMNVNTMHNNRAELIPEIEFLKNEIRDVNAILTWPFDYKQLLVAGVLEVFAIVSSALSVESIVLPLLQNLM